MLGLEYSVIEPFSICQMEESGHRAAERKKADENACRLSIMLQMNTLTPVAANPSIHTIPRNSDIPTRPGQGLIARVALHIPNVQTQRRQRHTAASGQPNHRTMHGERRRCREATHRARRASEKLSHSQARKQSSCPFFFFARGRDRACVLPVSPHVRRPAPIHLTSARFSPTCPPSPKAPLLPLAFLFSERRGTRNEATTTRENR
jgi:hypothetical protein